MKEKMKRTVQANGYEVVLDLTEQVLSLGVLEDVCFQEPVLTPRPVL